MASKHEAPGPRSGSGWTVGLVATAAVLGLMMFESWKVTDSIDQASIGLGIAPARAAQNAKTDGDHKKAQAAIAALKKVTGYDAARWHPIHFKGQIEKASDAECLVCHKEVLADKVRPVAPAGNKAADALAWYQTLDTYAGEQLTFHQRHLSSPMAQQFMSLKCNFCHQGNDPREEAAGSSATTTSADTGTHDLRKMVVTTSTCLLCHGTFPAENMGLEGKWSELREGMESPEQPNGCLTCHGEQFRTVRHQVSYLKADAIEAAAKSQPDLCFGCHGGRQWYRISYPYPRHPWPGMDTSTMPDWAKNRSTESDPRYAIKK